MDSNNEIIYNGFATPSLILEGSDGEDNGSVIDKYSKLSNGNTLICGKWRKGFEDGLIHIWLMKPVATICDEREEWAAKLTTSETPINYMPQVGEETESHTNIKKRSKGPKPRYELDPETKKFRLM